MSSDSEDDYYCKKPSSKRESEAHSRKHRSEKSKLRLREGRYRSPSPQSPDSAYQWKYGNKSPSPEKKHSKHRGRDRYKEDRHGPHYSGRSEEEYLQRRLQKRMWISKHSSPSSPRSRMTGDPNIPERRIIAIPMPEENVLQKMTHSFTDGPLDGLKRCVHEGNKVMVWIRNQRGIRGICTGYVIAFDKFWNLIMRDVDETYQKSRKPKCPYLKRVIKSENIPEAVPNVKLDTADSSKKKDKDKNAIEKEKKPASEEKVIEVIDLEPEGKPESNAETEPEDPEKVKRSINRKQTQVSKKQSQLCMRYLTKIFVRGDNIVFIRICQ